MLLKIFLCLASKIIYVEKSEIALSDIIVGDAKYLGLQIDSHYPLTNCNSAASTPKMDNETKQVRSIFFLFIYNENEFTDIVWNQLESRHFLRQLHFPSFPACF